VPAGTAAEQVRRYLAALPPPARRRMQEVRSLVKSIAPTATETFSYRIPGFRLDGRVFVYYAAFKDHTSLYPMGERIRRANAAALQGLKTSTGTIQFPLDQPLPVALVNRLIKARIREVRVTPTARS
jgi:uncharacterized protein YdhG (YjbR/CyaY superfamily)